LKHTSLSTNGTGIICTGSKAVTSANVPKACNVTLLSENGAKTVLVPMDNLSEMTTLPQSILGVTDTPFYGNSQMLLQKAVLNE